MRRWATKSDESPDPCHIPRRNEQNHRFVAICASYATFFTRFASPRWLPRMHSFPKSARRGQKSSICEELVLGNLTSRNLTWANAGLRRIRRPHRPLKTRISAFFVHESDFSRKKAASALAVKPSCGSAREAPSPSKPSNGIPRESSPSAPPQEAPSSTVPREALAGPPSA